MSRRRPRISECETPQDFVRAGVLRPVQPSVSTGHCSYPSGRRFLAAGAEAATILRYARTAGDLNVGTVAFRFIPEWAGNDNTEHDLFYVRNAANSSLTMYAFKSTSNTLTCTVRDSDNTSISSAAQSFAASTPHFIVARWTASTIDLNHDGTDVEQVAHERTLASGTIMQVGANLTASIPATGTVGPLVVSQSAKSDAWVASIQAASGAVYGSIPRLVGLMSVGDFIAPLISDSTAFVKAK